MPSHSPEYCALRYESAPPLAWITLSRPGQDNQVDLLTCQELRAVASRLEEEPRVRALVITGDGPVFSRGRAAVPPSVVQQGSGEVARWLAQRRAAAVLAGIPVPVVAALNGDAVDHGLELALACDLRIAQRGAFLGVTDVGHGCLPWDGATQRLPRLIGRSCALDMLLTSRLVPAEEAHRMGLVNAVVDVNALESTAREQAEAIAAGAPIASRYAREAVYAGMDLPLGQGLRLEADLGILLHGSRDRQEGIRSFREKRAPRHRGE